MKKIDLIKLTKSLTGQHDISDLISSAEKLHIWLKADLQKDHTLENRIKNSLIRNNDDDRNVSYLNGHTIIPPEPTANIFTTIVTPPSEKDIENNRERFGKNFQKEKKCIALTTIDLLNISENKKEEYKLLLKDYKDDEIIKFSVDNNVFILYNDKIEKELQSENKFNIDIFSKYKTNNDTYILSTSDFKLLIDSNENLNDDEKKKLITASGLNLISGGQNSYSIEIKMEEGKPVIFGKIYTKVTSEYNPNVKTFVYSKESILNKISLSGLDDSEKLLLTQVVNSQPYDFLTVEISKDLTHIHIIEDTGHGYKKSMTNKEALVFVNKLDNVDFNIRRSIIEKLSHKNENDIVTIIYNYNSKLEIIENIYSKNDIIIDGLPKMIINYKKKNILQNNIIYTDSYLDIINDKIEKGWNSYTAFYGTQTSKITDTILAILLNKVLYKENLNILYIRDESNKNTHKEILHCFKQQLNHTIIEDKTNNGDYFFIGDREDGNLFSCSINFCHYKDIEKIAKYCKDNSKGYEYIIFDDCSIVSFSQVEPILSSILDINHNQIIINHKLNSPDEVIDIDERSLTYKIVTNYFPNKNGTYLY